MGSYLLLEELGRGGMSVVHRARTPDGREVALKLLLAGDPAELAAFARERRLQDQLGAEEGFVPLLDSGVERGRPWLAMPLLPGGSLRDRLRGGPLPQAEALRLVTSLARAVGRAHALGVVHRDLKPENVLFDAQGRPLVADLGLAKHFVRAGVPGATASAARTASGVLMGTPGYMAPEQASDARAAGPPADVFALGALLFECLSGERLYPATSLIALLQQLQRPAQTLAERGLRAPAWLEALLARCLALEPSARFPHAGALAEALEAGPGASVPRRGRGARASLAILLLGAGLAGALTWSRRPPTTQTLSGPQASGAAPTSAVSAAKGQSREVRALVARAFRLFQRRELQAAERLLDRAVALDPDDVDARMGRANVLVALQRHTEVLRDLDHALSVPSDRAAELHRLRGLARFFVGEYQSALSDLDLALAAAPDYQAFVGRGRSRLELGDLEGAREDFARASRLRPNDPTPHVLSFRVAVRQSAPRRGLDDLTRAIALAPVDPQSWALRGRLLGNLLEPGLARRDLAWAVALCPPGPRAQELERDLRSIVQRLHPRRSAGQLVVQAGRALKTDPAAALRLLDDAVVLAPADAEARYGRGTALGRLGDLAGAVEDYGQALALAPHRADILCDRAVLLRALGDRAGALRDYDRSIELAPTAEAFWQRAALHMQEGRLPEEERDLTAAIGLDPRNAEYHLVRAKVRIELQDLPGALADLDRSLELEPDQAEALYLRATARRGWDDAGARADLTRALELAPDASWAPTARQGLAQLERLAATDR